MDMESNNSCIPVNSDINIDILKRKRPESSNVNTTENSTTNVKKLKKLENFDKTLFPTFNQEPSLDLMEHTTTLSELLDFRREITNYCTQNLSLSLLAKFVHESDLDIENLALVVKNKLFPKNKNNLDTLKDNDQNIINNIKNQIESCKVFQRVNYGLDDTVENKKYSVWRWEVNDIKYFPEDLKEILLERKSYRKTFRENLLKAANTALLKHDVNNTSFPLTPKKSMTPKNCNPVTYKKTPTSKAERNAEKKVEKEKKEAEKLARENMKLIKEKERLLEKERKELEKKLKEEEKERKHHNQKTAKLAKEDEKKLMEEAKLKKENKQKSIMGFFSKVDKQAKPLDEVMTTDEAHLYYRQLFPPFHVKSRMKLALINKFYPTLNEEQFPYPLKENFDTLFFGEEEGNCIFMQKETKISLVSLKNVLLELNRIKQLRLKNRKHVLSSSENDVVVLEGKNEITEKDEIIDVDCLNNERRLNLKDTPIKLLQFHENVRPAFYGYVNLKDSAILRNGKNPFKMDRVRFDYDFDSEAEWEEEEVEGEELKSDEEEDGEADGDIADEEDGWCVPHGYLSDDERDEDQVIKVSKDFPRRKKLEKLKAVIIGPLHVINEPKILIADQDGIVTKSPILKTYAKNITNADDNVDYTREIEFLKSFPVNFFDENIQAIDPNEENLGKSCSGLSTPDANKSKADNYLTIIMNPKNFLNTENIKQAINKKKASPNNNENRSKKLLFPEEHIGDLKELIKGSQKTTVKLIEDIKEKWPTVSKAQIEIKLRQIAIKEKRNDDSVNIK
ncbi:hypothetical protein HK099_006596 [Clydaea vesicula]|uniref:Chromatin assembly factor 1 subunit A n=1 Tax=Clydaea vesicula TaxID=447962 RepID=A0AAD5U7T6_9FUNG|nr:hypothetical protein HK099_006596 [Clydaea vesicula]